jgi:MFS family permease
VKGALGAYSQLLDVPGARGPFVTSAIGRLPLGAAGLAVILLVRATTGSFADAGLVEGAFTIGAGIGLPVQGRLVDRLAQAPVVIPSALGHAAALVAFAVAAHSDASIGVLCALTAIAGALVPPLSPCMRSLWASLLGPERDLQAAYALDAIIIELAFIAGPLLAAGLAAAVSPTAAVLVSAALAGGGGLAFALTRASRAWRSKGGPRHWAGPLRSMGIRILAASSLGLGFANGALAIALTAFGAKHGSTEAVGPLISIQAVASMIGGLWYGSRDWAGPVERRYVIALALLAAGFVPLLVASSIAAMGVLIVLAGLTLAPATAIEYVLIDRVAPAGSSTEAFGWVITATVAGAGVGSAVAGAVVNGGHVTLGLLLAVVGTAAGAAAAAFGLPALRPATSSA